jgi:ABC-type amino acid transport substrate-binding protein
VGDGAKDLFTYNADVAAIYATEYTIEALMGEIEKFLKEKCFPALLMIAVLIFCSVTPSLPALAGYKGQSESQKIVVGGDYNYPPYEFIDEAGEPAGYNVDLTRAVAEVFGGR